MEFISEWFFWLIGWGLPFLFVLTIVVFFHELGHFLIARWNGVGVVKFAIGFGPDLFKFKDKHGTIWALSAIPLGGYVKFIDDANAASMPGRLDELKAQGHNEDDFFSTKKLWQRAAVVAAGPLANFILAIVIFSCIFFVNGRDILPPKVASVLPGSAAEEAGFKSGDVILSVDGALVESFHDLQRIVSLSAEVELSFNLKRDQDIISLKATPALKEVESFLGDKQRIGLIGIQAAGDRNSIINKQYGPFEAVGAGVHETWFVMKQTVLFFGRLIRGRESVESLGGPLRIAEVSQKVWSISFSALVGLTAVLSISIGIMNLFPIPVLDGGHLLFYALEALKGRPLSAKTQEICYKIGLCVLLGFMVFVTTLDVSRLLG